MSENIEIQTVTPLGAPPKVPTLECAQQTVSVPTDRLARTFIQILRDKAGITKPDSWSYSGKPNDHDDLVAELLKGDDDEADRNCLPADVVIAAILLAREIEADDLSLLKALKREVPVFTIQVPEENWLEPVREVLEQCILGSSRKLARDSIINVMHDRKVLGLIRDSHPTKSDDTAIIAANHRSVPIVGIAVDVKTYLPRLLLRTATHQLRLPQIDQSAIALVIETAYGIAASRPMKHDMVRAVDVDDLSLAIQPSDIKEGGADRALERLEAIIEKKLSADFDGPSLDEMHGYGDAKEWGLHLASDLQDYRNGVIDWSQVSGHGLLLSGPPGVGKTAYAKALAKTCRVPLIATSVAQWNASGHLGDTLKAIRTVFAKARKCAPSVLFIDELDGISDRSKLNSDYREYWLQIVNLLLEELQGIEDREGVIVVGASNHPDAIDPAVRRAGRLDHEITIKLPNATDMAGILRFHLGAEQSALLTDEAIMRVAARMEGKSGADAEALVRRAKASARRARRDLTLSDLLYKAGLNGAFLDQEIAYQIAFHEAGHAVISHLYGETVSYVSFDQKGGLTEVANSPRILDLKALENSISMTLGGMAAEKIITGRHTAGASGGKNSDLARATQVALHIEAMSGFGNLGYIDLSTVQQDQLLYSPIIQKHVAARIDRIMTATEIMISANVDFVKDVAEQLASEQFVGRQAFLEIAGKHDLKLPDHTDRKGDAQ